MAAEVVDDHEIREAQRDYLDFLDDDVSVSPTAIVPPEVSSLLFFSTDGGYFFCHALSFITHEILFLDSVNRRKCT